MTCSWIGIKISVWNVFLFFKPSFYLLTQKHCFDKACCLTEVIGFYFNFMGLVKRLPICFPFGSSKAKQSKDVEYNQMTFLE